MTEKLSSARLRTVEDTHWAQTTVRISISQDQPQVGAGQRRVGGLGGDDLVTLRSQLGNELRGVLGLGQQEVVPARQLLAERAVAAVVLVAGDAGEQALRADAAAKLKHFGGARDDLAGHALVERGPRVEAAALLRAQRVAVRALDVDVLHVDDEEGRRRGLDHRVVRLGRAVVVEGTVGGLPGYAGPQKR
jgi:hypothetical protein